MRPPRSVPAHSRSSRLRLRRSALESRNGLPRLPSDGRTVSPSPSLSPTPSTETAAPPSSASINRRSNSLTPRTTPPWDRHLPRPSRSDETIVPRAPSRAESRMTTSSARSPFEKSTRTPAVGSDRSASPASAPSNTTVTACPLARAYRDSSATNASRLAATSPHSPPPLPTTFYPSITISPLPPPQTPPPPPPPPPHPARPPRPHPPPRPPPPTRPPPRAAEIQPELCGRGGHRGG